MSKQIRDAKTRIAQAQEKYMKSIHGTKITIREILDYLIRSRRRSDGQDFVNIQELSNWLISYAEEK